MRSRRSDLAGGADLLRARRQGEAHPGFVGPGALDGRRHSGRPCRVSGCSSSRGSFAAERCCPSTIRTSRRRSRMSHTDPPSPRLRRDWRPGRLIRTPKSRHEHTRRRRAARSSALPSDLCRGHRTWSSSLMYASVLVLRSDQAAKNDPAVVPAGAAGRSQMPRTTAGNPSSASVRVRSSSSTSRPCWQSSARWRQRRLAIVRLGRREVRDGAHPDLRSQEADPAARPAGARRRGGRSVARDAACRLRRILERPDDHAPAGRSGRSRAGTSSGQLTEARAPAPEQATRQATIGQ